MKIEFRNTKKQLVTLAAGLMIALAFTFTLPTNLIAETHPFELNPNGTSHIHWPFADSSWENQNPWVVTCKPGCGYHHIGDYYADDWARTDPATCGQPFCSPIEGTVIFAADTGGPYGKRVVVQSSDDLNFAFSISHLHKILVSLYQPVSVGTKLGEIGKTGTDKCHAHCVLHKDINAKYLGEMTGLQRLKDGLSLGAGLKGDRNTFAAPYLFDAVGQKTTVDIENVPNPISIGQTAELLFSMEHHGQGFSADLHLYFISDKISWLKSLSFSVPADSKVTNHRLVSYSLNPTDATYVGFLVQLHDVHTGELIKYDIEVVGIEFPVPLAPMLQQRAFSHIGNFNAASPRPTEQANVEGNFIITNPGGQRARPANKLATTWGSLKSQRR